MALARSKSIWLSRRGATFIEGLVAASLLSFGGLALGTSFYQVQKSRNKTQTVATAVALESSILSALNRNETFTEAQRQQMSRGTLPALTVNLPEFDVTLPIDGNPLCLRKDGKLAGGNSFASNGCNILVNIGIRLDPTTNSFRIAYRIDVNPEIIAIGRIGEMSGANQFSNEDYSHTVAIQNYTSDTFSKCEPGELGVKAYNRDTGEVECFRRPQATCPDGTLPKSLIYDSTTGPNGSIEIVCENSQNIVCPDSYSLHGFSPISLDPKTDPQSGTCVYIARNTETYLGGASSGWFHSSPDRSLLGVVCPNDYVFTTTGSSCQINPATISMSNGTCIENTWSRNCGSWEADPLNVAQERRFCDYIEIPGSRSVAAVPGNASFESTGNPREAFCRLNIPGQVCGSRWTAAVSMRITCTLDTANVPESRPVL